MTRVPLAFCFLCSFPFVFFHYLASLSLVISLARLFPLLHYFGERVAATEPRQEMEKIVCRHSLDRLNTSMIKQKKNQLIVHHIMSNHFFPFVIFHCLASLSLVISFGRLFPLLHYLGELVAATEPDLRGGTADRKRKK